MTDDLSAKERATKAMSWFIGDPPLCADHEELYDMTVHAIRQAEAAAVAREREEILRAAKKQKSEAHKIVGKYHTRPELNKAWKAGVYDGAKWFIEAIKARSEP